MSGYSLFATVLAELFVAIAVMGSAYQLLAAFAVRRLVSRPRPIPRERPPVTLLKPLCGDEWELTRNLKSFCALDYPVTQLVCGVRQEDDPAAAIVRTLRQQLPDADIALVAADVQHGTNNKVSNVINMMSAAKHDLLVLSDSDMLVDPHYLDAVVAAMEQPGVGLATCLYLGAPAPGVWSAIGAAGINFWFLPSASVSKLLGGKTGCYGATIAMNRKTLAAIGGFEAVKNQLADDYALGDLVQRSGRQVAVVPYFPATVIDEPTFGALYRHELRWARTIRNTAPWGFAGSIITHPLPFAVLGLALGSVAGLPWPMLLSVLASAWLCRLGLLTFVSRRLGAPKLHWWLLLPRDALSVAILVAAFFGRSVSWRSSAFRVDKVGALSRKTNGN